MATKIITKFTVGSERGLVVLGYLTGAIAREKFSGLVEPEMLTNYIKDRFNLVRLINETNSMANQWLVVYVDDEPAGYARITSDGKRPEILSHQRVIRIMDFGLLKEYDNTETRRSLFDKCMSACRSYERIWITEYTKNPYLAFFETEGFVRQEGADRLADLSLDAVCLID